MLQQCVALASGGKPPSPVEDWPALFDLSVAERCAALAWLRSERFIRDSAATDVADRWATWLTSHRDRVQAEAAVLAQLHDWFMAHDVSPVVLKGLPLSLRLYGDVAARQVNDIDLYVPVGDYPAATEVMRATGWKLLRGRAPGDLEFVKNADGVMTMAELHATLGGPWHSDLPFPPVQSSRLPVGGRDVLAMSGSFVAAYLSSHLLQHAVRPLLWLMDLKTHWDSMTTAERSDAHSSSRTARLHGVLNLTEQWTTLLARVARGDSESTSLLRTVVLRPSPIRAFTQLVTTAATAGDAARCVLQLVWPRNLRAEGRSPISIWGGRIWRRTRGGAQSRTDIRATGTPASPGGLP